MSNLPAMFERVSYEFDEVSPIEAYHRVAAVVKAYEGYGDALFAQVLSKYDPARPMSEAHLAYYRRLPMSDLYALSIMITLMHLSSHQYALACRHAVMSVLIGKFGENASVEEMESFCEELISVRYHDA